MDAREGQDRQASAGYSSVSRGSISIGISRESRDVEAPRSEQVVLQGAPACRFKIITVYLVLLTGESLEYEYALEHDIV